MAAIEVLGRLVPNLFKFLWVFSGKDCQANSRRRHAGGPLPAQQEVCCGAESAKHQNPFPILAHLHFALHGRVCPPS